MYKGPVTPNAWSDEMLNNGRQMELDDCMASRPPINRYVVSHTNYTSLILL